MQPLMLRGHLLIKTVTFMKTSRRKERIKWAVVMLISLLLSLLFQPGESQPAHLKQALGPASYNLPLPVGLFPTSSRQPRDLSKNLFSNQNKQATKVNSIFEFRFGN